MSQQLLSICLSVALSTAVAVGAQSVAQGGAEGGAVAPGVEQGRPTAVPSGPVAVPQRVVAALQRAGRVRVLVGVSVRFAPEGLLSAVQRVEQRNDIAVAQDAVAAALGQFQAGNVRRFRFIPALATEADAAVLQMLARRPDVTYIELDELAAPTLAESAAIVGAPAAWASGYNGAGQTVAVLDTGVERTHPFLGGRVVSEACYSTTTSGPGYTSSSVCPGGAPSAVGTNAGAPCPLSECDHGTHVAGIAAGSGPDFHGIARGANLISIQVFSSFTSNDLCGPGASPCVLTFTSDQISGLERVYALRTTYNIAAANMSLGGGQYTDQPQCDAANTSRKAIIDTLRSVGIATVISSGNDGFLDALSAPACISTAVSVGSTTDGSFDATPADEVSNFSNSASFLRLLAPGHWITSSVPGGGFAIFRGTSMAAPHVAGAWAVLKSRSPSATVTQILDALTATGTGVLDSGNGLTKPRINVPAALSALGSGGCAYTVSPTTASVPAAGGLLTITVSTGNGCAWTAASNAPFVTITAGTSGTGSGSVSVAVSANASPLQRTGTLTVAGTTVTVTEERSARGPTLDFNGDGSLDLLWHHQGDGRVAAWLMRGTSEVAGTLLSPGQVPDTDWKLSGAGDLDGDGQVDLIWQNIVDGRVSAWLMNGLSLRRGELLDTAPVSDTQWRIRAVGDLDRDGHADIFWQHDGNGSLAVWRMHGLTVLEGTLLNPAQVADTNWKLVGTADFDGDGRLDLVWHHQTDGRISVWFMNGTSMTRGFLTTPGQVADTSWKIRAVADVNADDHPDLIWQHIGDGRLAVWLMNGLTQISGTPLSPSQVSDTNWQIVGPR